MLWEGIVLRPYPHIFPLKVVNQLKIPEKEYQPLSYGS